MIKWLQVMASYYPIAAEKAVTCSDLPIGRMDKDGSKVVFSCNCEDNST